MVPHMISKLRESFPFRQIKQLCFMWNFIRTYNINRILHCRLGIRISSVHIKKTHFTYNFFHSFNHFVGTHEPNKLTSSPLSDFMAQLVRTLHRHERGYRFESHWSHLNFFGCIYNNCLNCLPSARIISSVQFQHSKIKFVSPRGHVISSICLTS